MMDDFFFSTKKILYAYCHFDHGKVTMGYCWVLLGSLLGAYWVEDVWVLRCLGYWIGNFVMKNMLKNS